MTVYLIITTGFLVFTMLERDNECTASTIYVGFGLGNQSTTINGGIALAQPGDTVFVHIGNYKENVVINKTINLTGENRDKTVIDGQGIYDTVFISADWVNVSRLSVTNSGFNGTPIDAGIELRNVQNCRVENINAYGNLEGIYLNNSDGNTLLNNTAFSNNHGSGNGIRLDCSNTNNITNNSLTLNNAYGIYLRLSGGNNITGNNATNNHISGIELDSSSNISVYKNICNHNGNFGIRLIDTSFSNIIDNIASSNGFYGIILWSSGSSSGSWTNETIYNNIIGNTASNNNWHGIDLWMANNNNVTGNIVSSNSREGIYIYLWSDGNNVYANNVSSNPIYGIHICYDATENIVSDNYVSNNGNGIYLSDSAENNDIFDNVISTNIARGIGLNNSRNNRVTGNFIYNNSEGINCTWSATSNEITDNNISNNGNGVAIFYSHENTMIGNTLYKNTLYGIDIKNSDNNTIYHNNFIYNNAEGIQASDNTGTNHWNDSYPNGGNYWSDFDEPGEGVYDDYEGVNQDVLGSDFIVDKGTIGGGGKNPYIIDVDSQDNYPLINLSQGLILYPGWNLISIPRIQIETDPGTVLSSISGAYRTIQWYNSSDSDDPWKHNCTTKPQYLNDFDSIDHLIGFWIYITEPGGVNLEYSGPLPGVPENIPLHTGWNMVGFPSLFNKDRTAGLNNLDFGVEVDAIWAFDGATQTWEEVGALDSFILGKGYWIHATQECVWEVPL